MNKNTGRDPGKRIEDQWITTVSCSFEDPHDNRTAPDTVQVGFNIGNPPVSRINDNDTGANCDKIFLISSSHELAGRTIILEKIRRLKGELSPNPGICCSCFVLFNERMMVLEDLLYVGGSSHGLEQL
ncbi:unnamed protein product [Caretta caretta]